MTAVIFQGFNYVLQIPGIFGINLGKDRHLQARQCNAVFEGAALMPKNQQIYRAFPSFSTKSELPHQRSLEDNALAVLSKREREGKGEEERQREREETKKINPQWELCYSGLSHL